MHIVHNGKCPFSFLYDIVVLLDMRIMDTRIIIGMMLCIEKQHFLLLSSFPATKIFQHPSNIVSLQ